MEWTKDNFKVVDWFYTTRGPHNNTPPGDKLFYFEPGCEYGTKDGQGVTWYRISCSYWFGDWIEENTNNEQWLRYGGKHRAIYVVREDLMTLIRLKWL